MNKTEYKQKKRECWHELGKKPHIHGYRHMEDMAQADIPAISTDTAARLNGCAL